MPEKSTDRISQDLAEQTIAVLRVARAASLGRDPGPDFFDTASYLIDRITEAAIAESARQRGDWISTDLADEVVAQVNEAVTEILNLDSTANPVSRRLRLLRDRVIGAAAESEVRS
jgi:hypothetical protein